MAMRGNHLTPAEESVTYIVTFTAIRTEVANIMQELECSTWTRPGGRCQIARARSYVEEALNLVGPQSDSIILVVHS